MVEHHKKSRKVGSPTDIAMEARTEAELPAGEEWWFEPKWAGFRCLAQRSADNVELRAKSGKSLTRYFPEVVEALARLRAKQFLLDSELLIWRGKASSFEDLQMRIHPAASRIQRLSKETPATLMVFDLLCDASGRDLRHTALAERREKLEAFIEREEASVLTLSRLTLSRQTAERWLASGKYEGVVAKLKADIYHPGERSMVKVKRRRTADCVVGGFRYATGSKLVGSLLLGLYNDEGLLDHVGFTSGFADIDRAALTRRLKCCKALRDSPAARPAGQVAGAMSEVRPGWRSSPRLLWRFHSITCRPAAFATAPVWSAFDRTRRRANAPWSN